MKKLICLLVMVVSATVMLAQASVTAEIDSTQIYIGNQAHLTISVVLDGKNKVVFPQYKPATFLVPQVEIEGVDADTLTNKDKSLTIRKIITITSFDENLYSIPQQKVIVGEKEYLTNELALKVITVDVDTLHPENFYPPYTVQDNPFMWQEWIPAFWLAGLICLLVAGVFLFRKTIYERFPLLRRIIERKKLKPHQKALQDIEQLREAKIAESDPKTYYTKLTDSLRLYISERFGFSAMEMTTAEIVDKLRDEDGMVMFDEVHSLLSTADLVKFAKYESLLAESDMNLLNAVRFIDETKLEEPVEEQQPILTEEENRNNSKHKWLNKLVTVIYIIIALIVVYLIYFSLNLIIQ